MNQSNNINNEETASIGEELDENFVFNDSSSLNRSITSLASSTASSDKKPSRPKSFSIHRLFKKQPKEHCKENCNCDECATKILSKTVSELPKIKCSFVSAPATPINHHIASSWTYGYTSPLKHNSSFSSVDEEESIPIDPEYPIGSPPNVHPDFLPRPERSDGTTPPDHDPTSTTIPSRSKSRLSLNLISNSKEKSPSPRIIPRFLRSSFSKLLHKTQNNTSTEEHSPDNSAENPSSLNSIPTSPNCNLPPMTPSTIEYMEEAKLSGLPVIPFAYPTCVLVDRMKNKTKDNEQILLSENNLKNNSSSAINNSSRKKSVQSTSSISDEMTDQVPKSPPGTLESIVGLAQQQLRAEQPFEEFDDDFFCGSLGSTPSSAQFHSIEKPLRNHGHKTRTWHDYIDMGPGSPTHGRRSIPIRIEGHPY